MKRKNFPARKLRRRLKARHLNPGMYKQELEQARAIRTKKNRDPKRLD